MLAPGFLDIDNIGDGSGSGLTPAMFGNEGVSPMTGGPLATPNCSNLDIGGFFSVRARAFSCAVFRISAAPSEGLC